MFDAPPPPAPYVISADLLYWTARETGNGFAIANDRILSPSYGRHFGFKVNAGIPLPLDAWQLIGTFTHFHARVTETLSSGPFLPTLSHPALTPQGTVDEVRSRWRLHMGFVDLVLKRSLSLSPSLSLAPFAGLRGAGVRFKARFDYRGGIFPNEEEDLSMKNKFWGVGTRLGFEAEGPLALYGRWAISQLYGEFYIHQDEEPNSGKLKLLDDYRTLISIHEVALGFNLHLAPCAEIRALWELQLLPSQNQWVNFVSSEMPGKYVTNLGNLALQGLTVGLHLSF